MKSFYSSFDIILVGAGISGCVLAQLYAQRGKKVLIVEKRNHIGGNCYDFINEKGIRESKYGAHLFHTSKEDVITYIQRFSVFVPYVHRVKAYVDDLYVPVPVTIDTVNLLFSAGITTEEEMIVWLQNERVPIEKPKNSEESALSRVGPRLYEKIFKNYTKKQWDKSPRELDPSVLERIPVRTTRDDRYFHDTFQALPQDGYTALFKSMLSDPNITVALNTDYFAIRDKIQDYERLFYTGPIDQFFDFKFSVPDKLEYRSLVFEREHHKIDLYQPYPVINYPNTQTYTRIVEYKHFYPKKNVWTTIVKEYSSADGEPYYPVPNPQNRAIYELYKKEAEKHPNIHFVGRLANYKYFNMDEAFHNAMELFQTLEGSIDQRKADYHFLA